MHPRDRLYAKPTNTLYSQVWFTYQSRSPDSHARGLSHNPLFCLSVCVPQWLTFVIKQQIRTYSGGTVRLSAFLHFPRSLLIQAADSFQLIPDEMLEPPEHFDIKLYIFIVSRCKIEVNAKTNITGSSHPFRVPLITQHGANESVPT